jgi:hypothetical protein
MNPGRLPLQDHRPGGLRLLPLLNNAKNRDRVSQDEEENLLVLRDSTQSTRVSDPFVVSR